MADEDGLPATRGTRSHEGLFVGETYDENKEDGEPLPSTSFDALNNTTSSNDDELTEYYSLNFPEWDMKVYVTSNDDDPVVFGAHKEVLILASPVFEMMITALDDGDNSVELQMDAEVFKIAKTFMYTNSLSNPLSMGISLDVLEASVAYNIDLLKLRISEEIKNNVTEEFAFQILEASRRLELSDLESHILEFICLHGTSLLKSEEFEELGWYDAFRILSSDSLVCADGEMEVFNAALRWSVRKSTCSSDFKKGVAFYFHELVQCIRFPIMSPVQLAKTVINAPSYILDKDDVLDLFKYVCLPKNMKNKISSKFVCRPRTFGNSVIMISRETQTEAECLPEVEFNPMGLDQPNSPKTNPQDDSLTANVTVPPPPNSPRPIASEAVAKKHNPRKRPYPKSFELPKVALAAKGSLRSTVVSSEEDAEEDLFHRIIKVENRKFEVFEDMFRKYYRDKDCASIGSLLLRNVSFKQLYRPVLMKNCKDFVVDAKFDFIKEDMEDSSVFLEFVKTFDPMRYLLCDTKETTQLTPEIIWSLEQDILLKFNGVTFVKIHQKEAEITLNYIQTSCRILSNNQLKPRKLALSNCEFSMKVLKDRIKQLENLILYRVWGEYTLEAIMKDCPCLTELVCWKHVPPAWIRESSVSIPLRLNFSSVFAAKNCLRKLVLYQTELRFPAKRCNTITSVFELCLEKCFCEGLDQQTRFLESFGKIFPCLKNFSIVEECGGNLATPTLINCVLKMHHIERLEVIGLKWSSQEVENGKIDRSQDDELKQFLSQIGLSDRPTNFQLEKSNGTWGGKSKDGADQEPTDIDGGYWTNRDQAEFQWYSVGNFYDACEVFEDFFIQDKMFPQPKLW